ncbi:MAG: hypothetical protein ACREWE_02495 [Gammaproteobacteria bacterium]
MKTKLLILALSCGLSFAAFAADKRTPPPNLGKLEGSEAQAFYLGVNA